MIGRGLGEFPVHCLRAEGRASSRPWPSHGADLGGAEAPSGTGLRRAGGGRRLRRAQGSGHQQPWHPCEAAGKEGWYHAVAEALREHAGQLLRRPRAARHPREGDQRLDRQHRPAAEQALPRRAGGGLGGRHWRRRKSGNNSGTISSRQR